MTEEKSESTVFIKRFDKIFGPSRQEVEHKQHERQANQPAHLASADEYSLERPCMDHMPWLLERSTATGGNAPCGHALMASCPPEPFPDLTPDIPFGFTNVSRIEGSSRGAGIVDPVVASGQRTWELTKADLATLLDLSKRLNLDGEITPVMAWGMVLGHPRLGELKPEDFGRLRDELSSKIRCYGFGAVLEEFEVRDALESIFSTKAELGMRY